jgi:hypothetical protein
MLDRNRGSGASVLRFRMRLEASPEDYLSDHNGQSTSLMPLGQSCDACICFLFISVGACSLTHYTSNLHFLCLPFRIFHDHQ